MRMIEQVLMNGWSDEAVATALSRLIVADGEPESATVASELLRWVRLAAQHDGVELADWIERLRPGGDDASAWDKLLRDVPIEPAVTELVSAFPTAAEAMCQELDRAVEVGTSWADLDWHHQRYVLALIVIGSPACLRYLIRRGDLLYGGDTRELWPVIEKRSAEWQTAVTEAWESLDWSSRATAVMMLDDMNVNIEDIVERVSQLNPLDLNMRDRVWYLTLLSCQLGSNAPERAYEIFQDSLKSSREDADSRAAVSESLHYLNREDLTTTELAAIARLGFVLESVYT